MRMAKDQDRRCSERFPRGAPVPSAPVGPHRTIFYRLNQLCLIPGGALGPDSARLPLPGRPFCDSAIHLYRITIV